MPVEGGIMNRCTSVYIFRTHICTQLYEHLHLLCVPMFSRQMKRGASIMICFVHVHPKRNLKLHCLDISPESSHVKCCISIIFPISHIWHIWHRWQISHQHPNCFCLLVANIITRRKRTKYAPIPCQLPQNIHYLCAPIHSSEPTGCKAAFTLCMQVCTQLCQHLYCLNMPLACGIMKCCVAIPILDVNIRSQLHQQFHHIRVSVTSSQMECRAPDIIHSMHISSKPY
mmetsp:Transcript_42770/g.81632  ORF Transcript_42770/g.81632 Transcript_42770/m.81632 type:complete len:228 (-) Transcript_42770:1431-2114(-)